MSEQISSGELINVWKSLAISEEDIEETPEILGRGAYGTVYAAKYCGSPCVVKEMHSVLSKESCEQFYKEAMAMKSLSHPCILQLYGVTSKKDMPYSPTLVMEQLWKTLDNLIKVYQCLEMYTRLNLLRDVVCALSYLHSKKILHRDLTPNNILITESCTAKISDFGQATYFRPQGQMSTCPGNSLYMPPEALEANPIYSCKLDVFSFACVFIFTVTGVVPLPDDQFIRIHGPNFEKVNEANRRKDSISKLKSLKQRTVVLNCIEDNPDDRPNSKDLLPQVEDCMKEIQLDSLSKKSKIELDQECLERTMKVEKENSNLKQWNSDLSAKLDDAKNQLDDAKSQLKEKDVIITELQNETKTLTKVYNDARNELKRSPAVLKESSGRQLASLILCTV